MRPGYASFWEGRFERGLSGCCAGRIVRRAVLSSALLLALAVPAQAGAVTTVFRPVADSYVSSGAPAGNYGTSTSLKVDGVPLVPTYLRFDLRGLTGPITRATLKLRSSSTTTGVSLHGLSDVSWGETAITYRNAPLIGPAVSSSGPFSTGQSASLDATSLVDGDGLLSLAVTTTSTTGKVFTSREGTQPPELVVEAGQPDPMIAAAGDIACDPADAGYNLGLGTTSRCRQKHVSDLLVGRELALEVAEREDLHRRR